MYRERDVMCGKRALPPEPASSAPAPTAGWRRWRGRRRPAAAPPWTGPRGRAPRSVLYLKDR